MSLWLALVWIVFIAILVGIYAFYRKRMADIAQQVAYETGNRIEKVLKAENVAEGRLLESFESFANPTEAVRAYQKTLAEAFPCPQASPPWNWTREDLELWRGQVQREQSSSRSRPTILASVVIALALTIGATVVTTITLNTVKPASPIAMQNGVAGGIPVQLPPSVSLPVQAIPAASPSVLPTAIAPAPASNPAGAAAPAPADIDSSWDSSKTTSYPAAYRGGADISNATGICWPATDANTDANCVPDPNVTQSFGSPTERENL